ASDERYWFSARKRSPKGWAISHRYSTVAETCGVPVRAGLPAMRSEQATQNAQMKDNPGTS
ncbi:hypothetical protein CXG44_28105, partial [Pseudomonas plecoglossicida]